MHFPLVWMEIQYSVHRASGLSCTLNYFDDFFCWDHDDVIEWKHFPRYWPFVRGIHRSPVNSPHKGQWRGALMFSLICVWIKRLSKQSWGWWLETPSRPLWRHRNDINEFWTVLGILRGLLQQRTPVRNSSLTQISRNLVRREHPFHVSNSFENLHCALQWCLRALCKPLKRFHSGGISYGQTKFRETRFGRTAYYFVPALGSRRRCDQWQIYFRYEFTFRVTDPACRHTIHRKSCMLPWTIWWQNYKR